MTNRDDWQKRFDEKFVDRKVKQVDSSNSIVIYPWKHPHSHQSQEVKAFIQAELNKVREEERGRIRKDLHIWSKFSGVGLVTLFDKKYKTTEKGDVW